MNGKNPIFNRRKRIVAGLAAFGILLVAGLVWFHRCGSPEDKTAASAPTARPVKSMVLSETTASETRVFPGLVQAASEADLAFRVSGPLIELNVRIGRRVEQGEELARIDPRDFQVNVKRLMASLDEARAALKAMRAGARAEDVAALEAELAAARARFTEAEKNFDRLKKLLANEVISQARFDEAEAAYHTAKAMVDARIQELTKARSGARAEDIEAAEAGIQRLTADLRAAKNALDDTKLMAPFDGVVNRKYLENHENVDAGVPVLSLLDLSDVEVRTTVPEDLVIRRASFAEIRCTLSAYANRRFQATLKEIGRKTDSANQSYPMTVILHVPDEVIVEPGMAAMVSVSLGRTGEGDTGFVVPTAAVFADAEGYPAVWRIDPTTYRVRKTRVVTAGLSGDAVGVVSGLSPGDRLVTAGARFLREEQEVRLLDEDSRDRP